MPLLLLLIKSKTDEAVPCPLRCTTSFDPVNPLDSLDPLTVFTGGVVEAEAAAPAVGRAGAGTGLFPGVYGTVCVWGGGRVDKV